MITEAIILAGGLGTRLRSAVPDVPKCMAPVAGRPFLSYVIDYFSKQGIKRFIFSIGYKHEVIEDYLMAVYNKLDYSTYVEEEPLGTGGAIHTACSLAISQDVLILNGDTFFEVNVEQLSNFHQRNDAECTIALKEMYDTDRYGVVEMDSTGRITSFKEKRFYQTSVINGGVYALNKKKFLKEQFPHKFSFEKDYFEKYYREKKIFGLKLDGYFIDIGIPEDFEQAQKDFTKK
jgi:D-glycero-alpha-D-manno-heptose 1-phosphate guanylyltransferase